MKYLLTLRGRQALRERVGSHPLLAFDLDGTLAPRAADPESLKLTPAIRSALHEVARHLPVIILSGRPRKDVFQRLAGVPVRDVYGSRGVEPTVAAKGTALREAQQRMGCDSAIYFGADESDEDVFSSCDPDHVLGVRIGNCASSRASYYLRKQSEIEFVLRFLWNSLL